MLTALAVFVLVWLFSTYNASIRPIFAGAILASTILVTLHVSFLTAPFALVLAVEFSRKPKELMMFVLPFVVLGGLLVAYHAATTGVTLFGRSGMSGFSQNYALIPITHPFSRSALVASVIQKLETAWFGAPVVVLVFLVGLALLLVKLFRKKRPARISLLALLAICGYLLFETSRMSYLMYVLPLLILIALVEAGAYVQPVRSVPYIAMAVAVALLIFAYQKQAMAASTGAKITRGNEHATRDAIAFISNGDVRTPRVMCSRSSVRLALQANGIEPITTHFMEFGDTTDTVEVSRLKPDYMMVWASSRPGFYVEQESRLRWLGEHYGRLALAIPEIGFDLSRDYFTPLDPKPDTLLVYRLN
jgi:hypothetical protein